MALADHRTPPLAPQAREAADAILPLSYLTSVMDWRVIHPLPSPPKGEGPGKGVILALQI